MADNGQDTTQNGQGAAHLSSDTFQQTLDQAGDKPVFVDFYADWCGPCKVAEPIVNKLADEYADKAMVTKLNVDDNNDLAAKHGVMSIPTVIMFKNGQEIDRKTGFPGEDGYRQMLDSSLQG